ncbi:cytochrome c oxidase assembly factor 3 homolog, mitochondrial isoform X2 [Sarcophilus harrisii]|uniref:cytochrome c oxidase assembly factor 3 homolog, mitochondrial isoform X2 n=1 Tax=Sarcophilus harrisii TaxID=9305 RepID=UPI001301E7A9|nr:cytochrome c oxidase assembly factor 3 homolog, mitochondrial isoform X2 [Sarcophilus harrisii]
MADTGAGGAAGSEAGKAPVAQRIDPARDKLSPAQLHFMRQVELSQWQKTLPQRRGRNILTGLSIGALVLAICIRWSRRFDCLMSHNQYPKI